MLEILVWRRPGMDDLTPKESNTVIARNEVKMGLNVFATPGISLFTYLVALCPNNS